MEVSCDCLFNHKGIGGTFLIHANAQNPGVENNKIE